jgi:agmatine deiminase
MKEPDIFFPPEWYEQDGVMLTWPHPMTDWAPILPEVEETYLRIAREIIRKEKLLIVCARKDTVSSYFSAEELSAVRFYEIPSNDTWARDHGPVFTFREGISVVNNFDFNGWGGKFEAALDNRIPGELFRSGAFRPESRYFDRSGFILEGGSIETDGAGTILTTTKCLLNPNRNNGLTRTLLEKKLGEFLGASRILWLDSGKLEGDDTDSHIDTLARFCDENTICYVRCIDPQDVHFDELKKMEQELRGLRNVDGKPYKLVPLPMVSPVRDDGGNRLPATYANFLIINQAVLLPLYGTAEDREAASILSEIFPGREIRGVESVPLIKQNGSLHCITMQIPKGFLV